MNFKDAQSRLKDAYGITLRKSDGEYRVNLAGGIEETAYYTDDLDDAFNTGVAMAERRDRQ